MVIFYMLLVLLFIPFAIWLFWYGWRIGQYLLSDKEILRQGFTSLHVCVPYLQEEVWVMKAFQIVIESPK